MPPTWRDVGSSRYPRPSRSTGEGSTLDPTSAPWRTIESAGPDWRGAPVATVTAVRPDGAVIRIAIVAVAGLVAVASFLVAASSGTGGSVEVDGGSPPPAGRGVRGDAGRTAGIGRAPGRVVVVEIVGAVQRPGVFRLPVGARVGDLVDAAGGFGPRVDTAGAGTR